MSNLGLERVLAGAGLTLLRTPVGDRHVLAAMREGGFALGGEASGHLLFHETAPGPRLGGHEAFLGDGLYTALRVLEVLAATGRDLAGLLDLVEAVRNDDPGMVDNVTGEIITNLVDATRLAIEAADMDERDGQLLGALLKWLAENGDDVRDDLEPYFTTALDYGGAQHG